jgi:Domain of unknown function (DUF2382)
VTTGRQDHPTDHTAPGQQGAPGPVEVVLHEERPLLRLDRVPVERVVLRRRVVEEVRQVEVTVRREVLEVTRERATGEEPSRSGPHRPLVVVLSEEVPVVELVTRPYERVVVHVDTVSGQQRVEAQVSREQVEVLTKGVGEHR